VVSALAEFLAGDFAAFIDAVGQYGKALVFRAAGTEVCRYVRRAQVSMATGL
jgi:hypothetical protein